MIRVFGLLLVMLPSLMVQAQGDSPRWTRVDGPPGGVMAELEQFSTGKLIANGIENVYTSDDDAISWQVLPTPFQEVATIIVTEDDVLVINESVPFVPFPPCQPYVLRSTDQGQTWQEQQVTEQGACIDRLYAGAGANLFAKVEGRGLYHSADAGASWKQLEGLSNAAFGAIDVAASSAGHLALIDHGGAVGRPSQLYLSGDNGMTWQVTELPERHASIRWLEITPEGTLIAQGAPSNASGNQVQEVVRSVDGGATWSVIFSGDERSEVTITPDGHVYVSPEHGHLWYSDSDGEAWSAIEHNFDYVIDVLPVHNGILAGTTRGLFMLEADDDLTTGAWVMRSTGINENTILSLAQDRQGGLYVGGFWGDLWYRQDDEAPWQLLHVRPSDAGQRISDVEAGSSRGEVYLVAGTEVRRSTDQGLTWNTVSGIEAYVGTRVASTGQGAVLVTERNRVARSEDGGETWTVSGEIPQTYTVWCDAQHTLVGTASGLYASYDDGFTWELLGLEGREVFDVTASGAHVYARVIGQGASVNEPAGLFYSSDSGRTWTFTWPTSSLRAMAATPDGVLYGSAYGGGCAGSLRGACSFGRSEDGGRTWTAFQEGLPGADTTTVTALVLRDDGTLMGSTFGRGLYRLRTRLSSRTDPLEKHEHPPFDLEVFPNPANKHINIRFFNYDLLCADCALKISIFDLLGRRLKEVEHKVLPNTSVYHISLDLNGIASGVYVASLKLMHYYVNKSFYIVR